MDVLDLFSGSKSLEKPTLDMGWNYFSIDYIEEYNPDMVADIGILNASDIGFRPDVVWASPECTTYSIAAISHHRRKNLETGSLDAVSDKAKTADAVLINLLKLIKDMNPKYWFIENPRGGLRKMDFMQPYNKYRHTVTYCQYGDSRMKPTDVYTNNINWIPRPMCKNGAPCHVSAPRGSKTGTQGMKNNYERSRVPQELLNEILDACK